MNALNAVNVSTRKDVLGIHLQIGIGCHVDGESINMYHT